MCRAVEKRDFISNRTRQRRTNTDAQNVDSYKKPVKDGDDEAREMGI